MIWGALILPIITIAILRWKFAARLALWEVGLLLIIPTLLILGSSYLVETMMTASTEYWGGWATYATYDEKWDEYIQKTCRSCSGSGKNEVCTDYDCSYVETHAPYWQLYNSNGETIDIAPSQFEALATRWGSRQFVAMNHPYYSIKGDRYKATWNNDIATLEPTVTNHWYENRVAVSDSVYRYPPVKREKDDGLFNYPAITENYNQRVILGDVGGQAATAEPVFQKINALLGHKKQVKLFVLLFVNKTLETAKKQEAYWQGGNKNELTVCIGVDSTGAIQWAHVFSWTDYSAIKVETRNFLIDQKQLDLVKLAEWLSPEIEEKFVRKPFKDFSYLTIAPPWWAILMVYFITAALCGGLGYWSAVNDFDADGRRVPSYRRRRY